MKIRWVFMKIWIILKLCWSLWHVENFRKNSNHLLKYIGYVFFNTNIVKILLKLGYIHDKL